MKLDMSETAGLVTGAAGNMGLAISKALVEAGASVLMTDRNAQLKALAADLGAEAFVADLSADGTTDAAVARTVETFGRIDFLANVAGLQDRGPFLELDDYRWDRLQAVNLRALVKTCRAAARYMVESGEGGSILNVSSTAGTVGTADVVGYGATKGGVTLLTQGMAVELAPQKIRVNALAPGYVRTAMTQDLFADEERRRQVVSKIPMGRVAEPEEMAPAAVFLLSPAASFITGTVLHADGGYTAQ